MNDTPITVRTVYVMGPTNAGKSTLLDAIRSDDRYGLVEVGKVLRAKYPPEHFQGQAAPKHTQVEAMSICLSEIRRHQADGRKAVFVDGQPRDVEQMNTLCEMHNRRSFLMLWAPEEVRTARAQLRDGHDPAKLKLSLDRMRGDCVVLFDLLCRLRLRDEMVLLYDTAKPGYNPVKAALIAETCAVEKPKP